MDPYHILLGYTHQSVRIGIAQIILGQERQFMQILNTPDVIRRNALLFHLLAVVGHILPYMVYLLYQFFVLNGYDLFPRSTFNLFLEIIFHWSKTSLRITHFSRVRTLSCSSPGIWPVPWLPLLSAMLLPAY